MFSGISGEPETRPPGIDDGITGDIRVVYQVIGCLLSTSNSCSLTSYLTRTPHTIRLLVRGSLQVQD